MIPGWYEHPRRFERNAPGPFYTTATNGRADCLQCGAPEHEAPDLLAPLGRRSDNPHDDTFFVRQPLTPDEVERACRACEVCCVLALRYGGKDRSIIHRLGNTPELCDYVEVRNRL